MLIINTSGQACNTPMWDDIMSFFWVAGSPDVSVVKNLSSNAGDEGLIPGWGRSPGEGNGYPLPYSCLGNPMDRQTWWATIHGVQRVRYDWAHMQDDSLKWSLPKDLLIGRDVLQDKPHTLKSQSHLSVANDIAFAIFAHLAPSHWNVVSPLFPPVPNYSPPRNSKLLQDRVY